MENNIALIRLAKNGNIAARNKVVEDNMGLVMSIVRRFSGRGAETEDLAQIGAIGLIKAVGNFDTDFGVKFSTYAVPMITGEIRRFLRDDGPVKVSRKLKEYALKGKKCEEILRKELNREPTINEISKMCEISPEDLICAFEAISAPESIYEQKGENISVIDSLCTESHEDTIVNKVLIEQILSQLTPKEQRIISLRYLNGETQNKISQIIGVSQVQISRIEKKTLEKIRNFMQQH